MKKRLRSAILVAAMMSVGLVSSAAVEAASKKTTPRPTVSAKKSATKSASKKAAARPTAKSAARAGKGGAAPGHGKRVKFVVTPRANQKFSIDDMESGQLVLQSASALVLDQTTGQPVVEKSSDMVVPIASISKLMTAMVVLDAKLPLQEVIAIGEEDVDGLKGTRSRMPVGTTMTRETALLLALMSSENRAAHALGRHYPGGLPAFVAAMNQKARALGMTRSSFEEPTGLSSNNVSTAQDLVKMVTAAMNYAEIRNFSTTAGAQVELNGRIREFANTNSLVRSDNWQIGLSKTGYISEAGRCLVMQAKVADKPVVIVLLDSVGKMTRVGDANRIKRWMEHAGLARDVKKA